MDLNHQRNYQVRPFYSMIFPCTTVNPDLITMLLNSRSFNPVEIYHEISRVYYHQGWYLHRVDRYHTILNPDTILSTLSICRHRTQITTIIPKENIKRCFTETIEGPYNRVNDSNWRASVGWWHVKYETGAEKNLFGMSIFDYLSHADRGNGDWQNFKTRLDFRYRVMKLLIP